MPLWRPHLGTDSAQIFVYTDNLTPNIMEEIPPPRVPLTDGDSRGLHHTTDRPVYTPSIGSTLESVFDEAQRDVQSRNSDSTAPSDASPSQLSLEELRLIEKSPRHEWDDDERLLLCIMYRWFEGDIPSVFNAITGLELKDHIIQKQFRDHLVLYGAKAFPRSFGKVFKSTPFSGLDEVYRGIRQIIEAEARRIGANLLRRQVEQPITSGRAARAKSEHTRKMYKDLVQRALIKERTAKTSTDPSNPVRLLGENTLNINESSVETGTLMDIEGHPSPPLLAQNFLTGSRSEVPCLAFRVWDDSSRTVYRDGGFIADLFADRHGPVTQPIPRDDPYDIWEVLAYSHCSFRGNASAFVSVATSLLQVLNYTWKMTKPQMAVINLNHPDLRVPNKLHHAREVIKTLQNKGEMSWTRYKGASEWLVWGNLPNSAVLHTFDLSELDDATEQSEEIRRLLQPQIFTSNSRTHTVAHRLQSRNLVLDATAAQAMGHLVNLFGLGGVNAAPAHITSFITCLVDGWSIRPHSVNNTHAMDLLAIDFVTTMNPRGASYRFHDAMEAFIKGVVQGCENLARFSHGPRGRYSNNPV